MASENLEKTELKQQGAIETAQAAAQDPGSHIRPETVEQKLVDENLKAGLPAYQFDPDASPEEKAAAAEAVCFQSYRSYPLKTAVRLRLFPF
jgi:hypothetical protein